MGILASWMVRDRGLVPAMLVLKGSGTMLILGIAVIGSRGEPRWWRAKRTQRWVPILGLALATLWFGLLAFRNALAMWIVARLNGP
jgi:hypothetical protein